VQTGAGGATIVVSRKYGGWRDRARSYVILVDGEPVAKIKHGQRVELPVAGGPHELFLKISWCQSRSFTFDARPAEVVEFFCEPGGPASAGLRDVLGGPDRYIRLTLVGRSASQVISPDSPGGDS
jgi:hypothetical protein